MTVDKRRGRWIAFDASFFDNNVGLMIRDRFGPVGIALFVAFLAACKRNVVQGQVEYGSEPDALAQFGLPGLELVNEKGDSFSLQSFWRALAAHKQVSTSTRGRLVQVRSSRWERWQEGFASQTTATKKRRSRAMNARDNTPPIEGQKPPELEIETDIETETKKEGSPAPPPASKRATGPPADFAIDDDQRAWAATNAPTVNIDRETERFLDHHRAKGSTFKDWRAAWRTWMSRAVDYGPKAGVVNGAHRTTAVERSWANIMADD